VNINETFARNVLIFRTAKGWSQEKLAEGAGLHRTYISQLERGHRNPTLSVLERVSSALDIQPTDLLKEESE
jgi:transcriptional regulator with XRE-family HTH domain